MKSVDEIGMLVKVATSMVKEAKNSDTIKKSKANVKEDLSNLKNSELPKKIAKDVFTKGKARVQALKEMLNSDEAQFIKTVVKESDQFKKVSKNMETVSDMIPFPLKREFINYKYWLIHNKA